MDRHTRDLLALRQVHEVGRQAERVRLADWECDEAIIARLSGLRGARFDRGLDLRAAHFLAVLHLCDVTAPRTELSLEWCTSHCGWAPLAEFFKDASRPTGLQSTRRACQSVRRKARYRAHRDEELVSREAWRQQPGNATRDNARRSAHARSNPEQESQRKHRRRSRELAAPRVDTSQEAWAERDRRRLRDRLRHCCQGCGERVPSTQGLDHLLPYAGGGTDLPGNLRLVCTSCNSSKRARTWMDWWMRRRRRGLSDVTSGRRPHR